MSTVEQVIPEVYLVVKTVASASTAPLPLLVAYISKINALPPSVPLLFTAGPRHCLALTCCQYVQLVLVTIGYTVTGGASLRCGRKCGAMCGCSLQVGQAFCAARLDDEWCRMRP